MADDEHPGFDDLITHLKEVRGFDFTGYKRSSLMRRIDRRMQEVGLSDYNEYHEYLELHPDEFTALFNTVLINVTSFFRDPETWTHLRESVIPQLLRTTERERLRIWSAGCADGQEAYSLAICLSEALGQSEFRRRVKIYATDVDEDALTAARQAVYSERDLQGVPDDLRDRYFTAAGERRSFSKELRRSVIFGRNDLIVNAPISHVDLLVCRNTLMYFTAETQAAILRRFHFALEPHGVLLLGKAEMLLSHGALFRPIDLKRRFFSKLAEPSLRERGPLMITRAARTEADVQRDHSTLFKQALVSGPQAQVVIGRDGRVALSNRRAQEIFGLSPNDHGRPFQDLDLSFRPTDLRSALEQSQSERRPVWVREVEWTRDDTEFWLDVHIVPLHDRDGTTVGASVTFAETTAYRQLQAELDYVHRQLKTAYEELQSTHEELETTNEELQSTVEELETTNEELQSTNEELETMNEELQSMNDELQSSNEELRERTTEIGDLNDFMRSILGSLEAGVVVVDRDLNIQVWNARMEELWGVRNDEAVGKPLLSLDIGLPMEELTSVLRSTLLDGASDQASGTVRAVNRRGRSIDVEVTVSPLHATAATAVIGAVILMGSRAMTAH